MLLSLSVKSLVTSWSKDPQIPKVSINSSASTWTDNWKVHIFTYEFKFWHVVMFTSVSQTMVKKYFSSEILMSFPDLATVNPEICNGIGSSIFVFVILTTPSLFSKVYFSLSKNISRAWGSRNEEPGGLDLNITLNEPSGFSTRVCEHRKGFLNWK